MVNIRDYEMYFTNAEPVDFKLREGGYIKLYPIKLKDALVYQWALQIASIDKNAINDISVIQMSYLDFLIERVCSEDDMATSQLYHLLSLCLGIKDMEFAKTSKGRNCINISFDGSTIGARITSTEFDDIIKIIQFQNDPSFEDDDMNPELRAEMEKYYKIKYANSVTPSLEKKKALVASKIGKTFTELNEYTYREFELIYDSLVNTDIYFAQKMVETSEKFKVEKMSVYPLFEPKKNKYDEVFDTTGASINGKGLGTVDLSNL